MAGKGAEVLLNPAAFLKKTGEAHCIIIIYFY